MRQKISLALFGILASACLAFGSPPDVPSEPVKVAVGDDAQVEISVAKDKVGAYAPGFDTKDCTLFRGYSDDATKMNFLIRPKVKGKFVVIFWTVGEGKSSRLVIDSTGGAPTPGPVDPVDDDLTKALQAVYTADTSADKAANVEKLAALYRQATVASEKVPATVDDPALKSVADLSAKMAEARGKLMPDSALLPLRRKIQEELTTVMGKDPAATLDATTRAKVKAEFLHVANALDAIK